MIRICIACGRHHEPTEDCTRDPHVPDRETSKAAARIAATEGRKTRRRAQEEAAKAAAAKAAAADIPPPRRYDQPNEGAAL